MTIFTAQNQEGAELLRQELPAGDFAWQIGRQDGCQLQLLDACISRRHALLTQENGLLFLEDFGSSSGTFVNGQPLQGRTQISPHDSLILGSCSVTLSPSPAAAPAAYEKSLSDQQATGLPPASAPASFQGSLAAPDVSEEERAILQEFADTMVLYEPEAMALTHSIHIDIVDRINQDSNNAKKIDSKEMQEKAELMLDQVLKERRHEIPTNIPYSMFRQALLDNIIDYGPLAPLIRSNRITEIMVNGPNTVFIEIKVGANKSRLLNSGIRFFDDKHLLSIIQRIVERVGRRVDDASPMVDARLTDGSRVNAIIPPLVLQGASLTIRKFSEKKLTTDDLVQFGTMTREMARFLEMAVNARQNILIAGGTGSGKTTLLNVLSQFIPRGERVITVEDSAELKLDHPNLLSLEARPPNADGKGRITIRDLVINTLRMRPDRIIVGECRGSEAFDMLQAMNTGHDGSMTTVHANTPRDALSRLENMVLMAGFELPSQAIREQIASAINLIVQQTRMADGSRKIEHITEITGREGDAILLQDIFNFEQTGRKQDEKGRIVLEGYHTATGNIPKFVEDLRSAGNTSLDMSIFVPKN